MNLIKRTSIEAFVEGHEKIVNNLSLIFELANECDQIAFNLGAGNISEWVVDATQARPTVGFSQADGETWARKRMSLKVWKSLVEKTGLKETLTKQQKEKWQSDLDDPEKVPEFELSTILTTFKNLYETQEERFKESVAHVFEKLSWNYESHLPHMLGKKIILTNMVDVGFQGNFCVGSADLNPIGDLEKVTCMLENKPIPPVELSTQTKLYEHICKHKKKAVQYEDEYFIFRYHKKGTMHVIFKRKDLVDRLNEIINEKYSNCLPPVKGA